jgi:hypothetical protein
MKPKKQTKAAVFLEGLNSLRLSVKEAKELIGIENNVAISILDAAYENTNPILLEKNCGCGK